LLEHIEKKFNISEASARQRLKISSQWEEGADILDEFAEFDAPLI